MKKIFTLIATALLTMGAYAQSTDVIELSGETLDLEKSVNPNFIFNGTDITIEMVRDPKVVENHGWKKGINIKNNGVGTIKLPAGVKLYGIEIYGFSQGDNWEYLLGWGAGDQKANDAFFEWVDPIGAGVMDNEEIKSKAKYPMDPCFFKSEEETVEYTNKLVMAEKFLDEPYEGAFNFTFSGNNQCDAMFVLYLSKEAAEKIGADAPENPGEGTTIDPTNLIPNFTYCWNDAESVVANADGTLTFNSASWGGVATWLGDDGVDFSAYKYVVFEFAEATTVATQPFIQYANGTANTTNWTAAGVTKAYAELNPDGASAVQQIACQTSDPTTLVITKIYLTNDDPNGSSVNPGPNGESETVLWEGEALVNGWGNQPGFLADGGADLTAAGAAVGDILRIYCSAPDDSWQVEFTEGHWGGMYFRYAPKDQGPNADGSAREYEIVDISNGYFDFVITEEFLTKATTQQWWGNVFLLNGDGNLTVTKVTLVKGDATSVQAVKAINTVDAIYNLAGQKVDASYKGIVIKGGKKFVVK